MNMYPSLQLESNTVDLGSIADLQIHIRRAVIEDDEISARYLDHLLADKPIARIAALYIAQNLYNIRRNHPAPVRKIIEFKSAKQPIQLRLWGAS